MYITVRYTVRYSVVSTYTKLQFATEVDIPAAQLNLFCAVQYCTSGTLQYNTLQYFSV